MKLCSSGFRPKHSLGCVRYFAQRKINKTKMANDESIENNPVLKKMHIEKQETIAIEIEAPTSIAASLPLDKIDFRTPKLEKDHLKLVSWNVGGFKAIVSKGFKEYVTKEQPDILCIQETKIDPSAVEEPVIPNYYQHFSIGQKKGYSGTGILSKTKPLKWTDGIGIKDHDEEGRTITAEFSSFYLVNTYVPNSGRGLVDLEYRTKWDNDFSAYLKSLDQHKPVILCGDLNVILYIILTWQVAHNEIDIKNAKQNRNKTAGFTDIEREAFTKLLQAGFIDTFRHLNPTKQDAYTFWSYLGNARAKNIGWRLDYFVISQRLAPLLANSYMRTQVGGSDHCPIVLHLSSNWERERLLWIGNQKEDPTTCNLAKLPKEVVKEIRDKLPRIQMK